MPNSKQIVYLSQSQYAELIANGTITVNGVTVTYDENDIYVTPQAEPVTDACINGTSITTNGVANIPLSKLNTFGVLRAQTDRGINYMSEGVIQISSANGVVKAGTNMWRPVVPTIQHESTFYGLAKVAGHDEKDSTKPLGTYTPEAKGAIQSMLGVSDLIATAENNLVASKAYAIGDIFTANGKLYKVITAIAANDTIVLQNSGETVSGANAVESSVGEGFVKFTDYATSTVPGVIKYHNSHGLIVDENGLMKIYGATDSDIKNTTSNRPIVPNKLHLATFYGLAKAAGADEKDSTLPVGQYTDTAKSAIRTMLGAVGDVQVDGTSVVTDGVANIPVIQAHGQIGAVRTNLRGLTYHNDPYDNTLPKVLGIDGASVSDCKQRTSYWKVATPACETAYVFYGLAGAAGDSTQKDSTNAVGTYTDNAKASIKSMLGIVDGSTGTVDITGATPTINAVENTRYVCGEVTSLSFTPPSSGISIVRFTSGSTVTVLTIPSTVKFPEWFDPTTLEANTIYEICVTDGIYGAVMSWAQ